MRTLPTWAHGALVLACAASSVLLAATVVRYTFAPYALTLAAALVLVAAGPLALATLPPGLRWPYLVNAVAVGALFLGALLGWATQPMAVIAVFYASWLVLPLTLGPTLFCIAGWVARPRSGPVVVASERRPTTE